MSLRLVPVTRHAANHFIAQHHRHNAPVLTAVFVIGVASDDELVGVAVAAWPSARRLADGVTLEVKRTCVKPDARHVNSMLYAACARAAAALGHRRLITYTLSHESGASLRGAGWTCEGDHFGHPRASIAWGTHAFKSGELFPDPRMPDGFKRRWTRTL